MLLLAGRGAGRAAGPVWIVLPPGLAVTAARAQGVEGASLGAERHRLAGALLRAPSSRGAT
jgi:hypothetical protein